MGNADISMNYGSRGYGRSSNYNNNRGRRLSRVSQGGKCSLGTLVVLFFGLVGLTLLGSNYNGSPTLDDSGNNEMLEFKGRKSGHIPLHGTTGGVPNVIRFGHNPTISGEDSRYWDKDDRKRTVDHSIDHLQASVEGLTVDRQKGSEKGKRSINTSGNGISHKEKNESNTDVKSNKPFGTFVGDENHQTRDQRNEGLYNEKSRNELKIYEAQYEADLREADSNKNRTNGVFSGISVTDNKKKEIESNGESSRGHADENPEIWNSDNIDVIDEVDDALKNGSIHGEDVLSDAHINNSIDVKAEKLNQNTHNSSIGSRKVQNDDEERMPLFVKFEAFQEIANALSMQKTNLTKRKRLKHPYITCQVPFLKSANGLTEPDNDSVFSNFSLQYIEKESPGEVPLWKPRFAGHQSFEERENSFYARSQKLHCGFLKDSQGLSTGFDLSEKDTEYLQSCHIAVASCIFGNSDYIRNPTRSKISGNSKENVCFVMFVDEKTLETLSSEGRTVDENGYLGLWKIVVVHNLPYKDMRRVGKVPKLLTHRLFPAARYSIWIDSKMRLNSDPLLILEFFLWRGGYEYAISNHYDRHCVWEEVKQNKYLNKYNHSIIDEQFAYYQSDGLTQFIESDPNMLLPSYVPEGSFIVRAHTPMSNLFSCLWFNEVDHFTPRDQLSFAYTFLKLKRMNPDKDFRLNMFKDCERRYISKLFHHRNEEIRLARSKNVSNI